jgi:hypothetical protein
MEHLKAGGDLLSLGVVGATLLQWLPAVAAGASLIWTCIRIYETRTVQNLIKKLHKQP